MKTFKNNITYKDTDGKTQRINFKSRDKMIDHLNKNKRKFDELSNVRVNFGVVCLPIKDTVWS